MMEGIEVEWSSGAVVAEGSRHWKSREARKERCLAIKRPVTSESEHSIDAPTEEHGKCWATKDKVPCGDSDENTDRFKPAPCTSISSEYSFGDSTCLWAIPCRIARTAPSS